MLPPNSSKHPLPVEARQRRGGSELMHTSTFEYLSPTPEQIETMQRVREAAKVFSLPFWKPNCRMAPDKTRWANPATTGPRAMWANIAITREADGSPR